MTIAVTGLVMETRDLIDKFYVSRGPTPISRPSWHRFGKFQKRPVILWPCGLTGQSRWNFSNRLFLAMAIREHSNLRTVNLYLNKVRDWTPCITRPNGHSKRVGWRLLSVILLLAPFVVYAHHPHKTKEFAASAQFRHSLLDVITKTNPTKRSENSTLSQHRAIPNTSPEQFRLERPETLLLSSSLVKFITSPIG